MTSRPRIREQKWFGWRRQLPDRRDVRLKPEAGPGVPSAINLTPHMPAVYDQGGLGSCTANAIAGALQFDQIKQSLPQFIPSRLFIYFEERRIEGTIASDAGAEIRDGMKVVARLGAPREKLWPYRIARFRDPPPQSCYKPALDMQAIEYAFVQQSLHALQQTLAAGYPVVFGFTCYESLDTDAVERSGILPMPRPGESVIGGHAVLLVGYDNKTKRFRVRNSWGADWGQHGYFEMPFDYVCDPELAADFWVVRKVG